MRRLIVPVLAAAALAGCGGERSGTATVWVTRDRGAHLLHEETVPAGLTAMQALERVAKVKTRYGGRFVQAVDGIEGDVSKQRDWFYYVNGVEAGVGAGEYRLHDGDIEWWDYRSWKRQMSVPVVVGAFPEPFEGSDTWVATSCCPAAARALAAAIGARTEKYLGVPTFTIAVVPGSPVFKGRRGSGGFVFVIGRRDALRLAQDPTLAKFRYEGLR